MTKARDLANAADVLDDVSATELSYVNGVTSSIQTQINGKQAVVSGVNDTEIGYLDGVTSAIQTQLDAKTAKSTLTTTGDIYYASAANTPARLGIGTASQVLQVNSGATAPEWATPSSGGMTLISTTTLSGASTSVSSIPATYVNLYVIIRNFDPASDGASLNMKFNSHTTYDFQTAFTGTANFGSTAIPTTGSQDNGTSNVLTTILIPNYAGTTWKIADCLTIGNQETTPANYQLYRAAGLANLTSAIDTLVFSCSSGNFSGGTVLLYGVK